MNRSFRAFVALVATALIATGCLAAPDGTFAGCVANSDGTLRVIQAHKGEECAKNEIPISWNQEGVPGADGKAGANGPAGADGRPGEVGLPGIPGPRGDQGEVGLPGIPGPQGIQGEVGIPGPQGIQGVPGEVGAAGPQGIQGAPGEVGAAGPQGIQGPAGATGATGPAGTAAPGASRMLIAGSRNLDYGLQNGAGPIVLDTITVPHNSAEAETVLVTAELPITGYQAMFGYCNLDAAGLNPRYNSPQVRVDVGNYDTVSMKLSVYRAANSGSFNVTLNCYSQYSIISGTYGQTFWTAFSGPGYMQSP